MKENQFFAMMSRMKYINRWGLMRNTYNENICEHSLQVAMIAHALGVIGNTYFNKNINSDRLAIMGMYHDSTEIITGDMPTPVKYYSPVIRNAYNDVEKRSKGPTACRNTGGNAACLCTIAFRYRRRKRIVEVCQGSG